MNSITYPAVTIDGESYRLKLSLTSVRKLQEWGVDIGSIQTEGGVFKIGTIAALVAACAQQQSPDGKWRHVAITPEDMEEAIAPREIGAVTQALVAAMEKAQQDASPALADPAPTNEG
jgi:hypothetical protein